MDIRIGVVHTAKEIEIEVAADTDPADITARVDEVLGGDSPILWITDRDGVQFGVPANRIAYVEVGTAQPKSRIGFGAG